MVQGLMESLERPHAWRARIEWLAERRLAFDLVFFGVLPPILFIAVLVGSVHDDVLGWDYRYAYHPAALDVLSGASPFPAPDDPSVHGKWAYVYPPLLAYLLVPLTPLSAMAGAVVTMVLFIAALAAAIWVLGVRDWRCYGMLLWWAPVFDGSRNVSISVALPLAVACAWRWRHSVAASAAALGHGIALKLFLAPLLLWPLVLRRPRIAAAGALVASLLVLVPWALLGFADLTRYPDLMRTLTAREDEISITPAAVAMSVGAPTHIARALSVLIGVLLLIVAIVVGRRGRDAQAFTLCLFAALALSPIVWVHYFALIAVPLAIVRPRLSVAWAVPLLSWGGIWWWDDPTARGVAFTAFALLAVFLVREAGRYDSGRRGSDPQPGPRSRTTMAARSSV
jgi:hypothetical protein